MSLAEKFPSEGPAKPFHAASAPALDNILRLALNNVGRAATSAASAAAAGHDRPEVDFGKAALLLDRATSALAQLTARRDELEQSLAAREEYYSEKVQQLQDSASEWERRAKVIKAQLQDSETRNADQQARIETLTFRAEQAESRSQAVEQQAAEMRRQLQLYHDKIFDTLGALA